MQSTFRPNVYFILFLFSSPFNLNFNGNEKKISFYQNKMNKNTMKKKMNLNCKSANRFPGKHMLGLIVLLFGSCIFMNITLCVLAFLCQQYDCAICSATLDTKHCRKYTFICCVLLYSFFSGAAVYFLFRVLISGCHYTLFSFVSTHLKHLVYMKRTFLVQC